MKTHRYLPAIVIISAVLLVLWKLAFTNLILARGDSFFYIYPYWEHRAREMLGGQLPLWNPYLFMGVPFLANPQAGVLYPLNWPLVPFAIPTAVKISIITHILVAAAGAFMLARHALKLSATGATLASLLFALGGHLNGKVEQVNQLQALAWLPWLLLAAHRLVYGSSTLARTRAGLAFAGILALQFLAGHTQTTFITLLAAALWSVSAVLGASDHLNRISTLRRALQLFPFTIMGILIAAAQLIPALELVRNSLRSTGLPLREAVSFSLHPLLFGRTLLPSLSHTVFTEFIAYVGITGLLFTLGGFAALFTSRAERARYIAPALLACCGLFLALGAYNPLYFPLVKFIPGFNLFRVPARWLALWALGAALLAGIGYDRIITFPKHFRYRLALVLSACIISLITLSFLSIGLTTAGETGPLPMPTSLDTTAWIVALTICLASLLFAPRKRAILLLLIAVELALASVHLPMNNLTTYDAYTSIRAPMTQLLLHRDNLPVPARMFSMSALHFDPGDLSDLRTKLQTDLPPRAVTTAIDAFKAKEVLSPNIPLIWRIPTIDGYDGGILPLHAYAQFTRHFTHDHELPEDGRLRERVINTPANWLLNITNTRWLLADKVEDVWRNDVFYDLQFQIALPSEDSTAMLVEPTFQATAVGLVLSAPQVENTLLGQLHLDLDDGSSRIVPIPADLATGGGQIPLGEPMNLTSIRIQSTIDELILRGAAVIDTRSGAFITLTLGPYRMAHSGNVKIYENLNVFPRAYLVNNIPLTAETYPIGQALIRTYTSRHIMVETESDYDATLVLADAHYPGWRATVDGKPTRIQPANAFFRSVKIPSGNHQVVFDYQPLSLRLGLWISTITLLLWAFGQRLTRRHARLSD